MQIADYKLKLALEPGQGSRGDGGVTGGAYFILENLNSNPAKCTGCRVRRAAYIYICICMCVGVGVCAHIDIYV